MGRTCCPSGAPKVTMVNVGGINVGMIAVGEIFQKLYEAEKKPEDINREELLSEFSIYNYIPSDSLSAHIHDAAYHFHDIQRIRYRLR